MFFVPMVPTFKEEAPAKKDGSDFSKTPLFTVGRGERKRKTRSSPETAQELVPGLLRPPASPDIEPLERIMSQASRSGVADLAGLTAAVNEVLFSAGIQARLPPPQANFSLALSEGGTGETGGFLRGMEREELFSLLLHLDTGASCSLQRRVIEELAGRDEEGEISEP